MSVSLKLSERREVTLTYECEEMVKMAMGFDQKDLDGNVDD